MQEFEILRVVLRTGAYLACTACGHDRFEAHEWKLNTTGMTAFGMDWMNRDATCYVCSECRMIHWFDVNAEFRFRDTRTRTPPRRGFPPPATHPRADPPNPAPEPTRIPHVPVRSPEHRFESRPAAENRIPYSPRFTARSRFAGSRRNRPTRATAPLPFLPQVSGAFSYSREVGRAGLEPATQGL
ncbi:hypothetical protein GCM10023405_02550 [Streptomonospora salina]